MSKGRKLTKKQQAVKPQNNTSVKITERFQGPIPPPSILEEYNKIVHGAAERIIAMAENEAAHRHLIEEIIIKSEAREARIGQVFALIIGVITIMTGGLTAVYGQAIAGAFIGTGGVVGLVSVFVWGRRKKS